MARFVKGKLCRSFVVAAVLVLICSCSVPAALAQQTVPVLNIDCGAAVQYSDTVTGLTWVPDEAYISTGKIQAPTLPSSLQSFTEMATLRYFDDARSKNCYWLPVVDGGAYLLKATFFYGNYDNANNPPMFQLAIDATIVANVTATSSDFLYSEFHYIAKGNVSYLCLLRTLASATPFISGISLRSASDLTNGYVDQYEMYLQQGIIMKTRSRVNYGGSGIVRAPDDYYDRFWVPEGTGSLYYLTPTTATYEFLSTTSTVYSSSGSWPPSAVMQTAVTSAGTLETYLWPQGAAEIETSVYISYYYTELNNSVSPLGVRNFTFQVPDLTTFTSTINMSGYVFLDYSGQDFWTGNAVRLGHNTTAVFTPLPSSTAGPILTCLEVFERSGPRVSKTADRDALAIEDIKTSLNLTDWTGDPCLPVPHAWLTCSSPYETSLIIHPVITAVNLSGYHLEGSIPASFAKLFDLTSLDLQSNNLSGSLPEWLATMKALRVLSVQNNNFSGPIPDALLAANSLIRFTYKPGNPFLSIPGTPPGSAPVTCSNCTTHKSNVAAIAGASAGGAVGLLLIVGLAICAYRRWQRKKTVSGDQGTNMMRITGGGKAYTLAELNTATSNFKRELGRGGFGPVYYGKLPDGQEVAVKVADGSSKHEGREFFTEVDVLSRVHHKNLVALLGYCQEDGQILVYEYMQNGSLFDHLHGTSMSNAVTLDWQMRLHIALNAAQGLEYLHTACSPSFIHRDVKSSNILLSSKYEAKVADFGLTRLLGEAEGTRVMTVVMGTAGYLDPEYYTSNYISSKSDVYSFGIVLLELISGSLPIDQSTPEGRNPNIAQWVRESLLKNDINSILDPVVKASNPNIEALWKVAEVAMQSVEPKGIHRPTMTEVVQELQRALTIETTNRPLASHSRVSSGFSDFSSGTYGPTSYPRPR